VTSTSAQLQAQEAHLRELGEAQGFSMEALEQNRLGRLHAAQMAQGARSGAGASLSLGLLGVLLAGGGVGAARYLHAKLKQPWSDLDMRGVYAFAVGGGLLGALFVAGAVLGFMKAARRKRAYARGLVQVTEGPIHKLRIEGQRGAPSHWLEVVAGPALRSPTAPASSSPTVRITAGSLSSNVQPRSRAGECTRHRS
jgi:hypothetical protein